MPPHGRLAYVRRGQLPGRMRLMAVRSRAPRLAVALLAAILAGRCGGDTGSVTSPSAFRAPRVIPHCAAAGEAVHCTAWVFAIPGEADREVQDAQWLADPPGIGQFGAPGLLTPVASGEVRIRARYRDWVSDWGPLYRVAPGEMARYVSFLGATVENATTGASLEHASVEVLTGSRAGAGCTTNSSGYCSVDRILGGEPFRVRVSREGFRPLERDVEIDQFGASPFVIFRLTPA